jgi:hypothetical protein
MDLASKSTNTIHLLMNTLAPRPLISLSLPHMTLRYDRGLAPKASLHLTYWGSQLQRKIASKLRWGEVVIEPNRAPRAPPGWTAWVISTRWWARHWAPSVPHILGILEAEKDGFKVAMGEVATEPNRAPRAPPGWTAWIISVRWWARSLVLNMVQLRRPQISADLRSAPLINPRR